jgi:hypothetical protein
MKPGPHYVEARFSAAHFSHRSWRGIIVAVIEKQVESLGEFLKEVFEACKRWEMDEGKSGFEAWFRGVSKTEYELTPRYYRLREPDEEQIQIDFERFGRQLVTRKPEDD